MGACSGDDTVHPSTPEAPNGHVDGGLGEDESWGLNADLWGEVLCRLDGASLVRMSGVNRRMLTLCPTIYPLDGCGVLSLLAPISREPLPRNDIDSLFDPDWKPTERDTPGLMPAQAHKAWPQLQVRYGPQMALPSESIILETAGLDKLQRVTGIPGLHLACGLGMANVATALVLAGCDPTSSYEPESFTDYSSPAWLRHFEHFSPCVQKHGESLWFAFLDAERRGGFEGAALKVAERHRNVKTLAAIQWARATWVTSP